MRQKNINIMVVGIVVPMVIAFVFFQHDIVSFLKINIYLFQALVLYVPLLMTIPLSKFLTRNWTSEQRENSKNGIQVSQRMQIVAVGALVVGFVFLAGRGLLADALSIEPGELGAIGFGVMFTVMIFLNLRYPQLFQFPPDDNQP